MPQGTNVSFVVFPDGKIDQKSLTISGERMAIEQCINAWLPRQFFGDGVTGMYANNLWRKMEENGFKVYTIKMNGDNPEIAI